jgi:hypothetical protein
VVGLLLEEGQLGDDLLGLCRVIRNQFVGVLVTINRKEIFARFKHRQNSLVGCNEDMVCDTFGSIYIALTETAFEFVLRNNSVTRQRRLAHDSVNTVSAGSFQAAHHKYWQLMGLIVPLLAHRAAELTVRRLHLYIIIHNQ